MVSTTICTFIREITIINMVIRILLTTFPALSLFSTVILIMSIPLEFITSKGIRNKLFHPLLCITDFNFFRYGRWIDRHCICVCLYYFPLFFNCYSFDVRYTLILYFWFYFFKGTKWKFINTHNPFTHVQGFVKVGLYCCIVESRHFKKEVCMFFFSSLLQIVKFGFSFFSHLLELSCWK